MLQTAWRYALKTRLMTVVRAPSCVQVGVNEQVDDNGPCSELRAGRR